jgi:hypothetical protein
MKFIIALLLPVAATASLRNSATGRYDDNGADVVKPPVERTTQEMPFDPTSQLVSYTDQGSCGPRGDDAKAALGVCTSVRDGSYKIVDEVKNDGWKTAAAIGGCNYFAYTVYECIIEEAEEAAFDPTSQLVSYTDQGSCGPRGDDAKAALGVCNGSYKIVDEVKLDAFKTVATIRGCKYVAYTVYECITTCVTDTELLMEQIHSNYNDAEMTETVLSTSQVFVDFSTNSRYNTLYAAACAEGEGNYQELHYTATCTKTGFEEKLIVSGHPRCYAPTCGQEEQATLLQDFAIQLMEERANENSNMVFKCQGEESKVRYSGLCDYQTQKLNIAEDLKLAQLDLKPSVDAKKFLWIFDRTEQLVTFAGGAGASNYQIACTASDGILSVKTIQALCTDEATDEVADVPYSIQGYTVCLASGCNSDATDTAALGSFVSMMKIQTEFSTTMACEVSGAGLLPMGVVMTLMFCSVLWQAC